MSLEKLKAVVPDEFANDIDFIDECIKKIDLDKDAKILDIGTGFGIMAIILALNGYVVLTGEPEVDPERDHHMEHGHSHGDDIPPYQNGGFEYDWKNAVKAVGVEKHIKHQFFDAQDLPFHYESFDGIFLYDALQHIKDRGLAIKECIRVIKPINGLIGIFETNKHGIEYYEKVDGFTIDYVDPREIINQDHNVNWKHLVFGSRKTCLQFLFPALAPSFY
jgi:SAM-dependent methyltransferase